MEKKKLAEEALELKHLKAIYNKAAEDIAKNISITDGKMEVLLANWDDLSDDDKSVYQSKIYQKNYQRQLQKQINDVLKDLNSGQYKSINEYLEKCYKTGFIGSMYDIAGQGIPVIAPIDQKKVIRAMKTNSKINKGLYTKLGEDVDHLKKRIANNISRGIATADSYKNIARNISNASNVGFNKAMRIARTEGHRIHSNSAHDAQLAAKDAGADIVKQWNSTLDGKTRPHHRQLDGQLREVEEPFEMGGMKAMYPSDFGRPEEDINCRCALMQRAKWALDGDELETLKKRAEYFGLDKTESFNDFRRKYLLATEEVVMMPAGFVPAKTIKEAAKVANDLGVKYAIYDDLPIGTANLFNEALMTLPKDARPVFVGSSKMLEQYRRAKLPRSSKNFYGVSIDTDGIFLGIDSSKAGAVKAFWDYDTFGNMVAISSHYKTADKITKAKQIAQEAYTKKHGRKWFFNIDGRATPFHEMGHAYANHYGLSDDFIIDAARWAEESGCDMLKKASEAWAEAWAAYHIKNPDLPDYIKKHIEKATLSNVKKSSNGLMAFDKDGIIDAKIGEFTKDLKDGKISTEFSKQKLAKHTLGSKKYNEYASTMYEKRGNMPSYLRPDLTEDDIHRLIDNKLGTGVIEIRGEYSVQEFFSCDEVMGYYYSKEKGDFVPTKRVQIIYALKDKNIHIVPVKDLSEV